ncbi:ABC transporter substrate-binding protein [Planomonospora sp. ID67723]|uniref:ABC transporter substrate-binding protein n=1 Tax=Planomonospora sp. ID67723 TaxID=2738134 RepID=UPI0018C41F84|nr:ABC transporter substrate-binding protein [Planomonospora sp. ID67723]MBG0828473.1 ABC transporter substrate-binding protein [Planomonospora sp. ID67723]
MRFRLASRAAVVGLAAMLSLAACGGSDPETTAAAAGGDGPEKTTLTIGLLPIPDDAAVYIANEKGFFKEEGLTIKPEVITGGAAAIPGLISGTLDATMTNYVSTFVASEKGNKLKIVTDFYQAGPNVFNLMAAKDSPIASVADLKGKKIAVNTLSNIGTLAVTATLKVNGLTADDVEFVELPFPNMTPALQKGDVDAAWMTEPFLTGAQKEFGAKKIADTMTGPMADFPIAGLAVTADFAEKNPKTVAAIQRALAKAQQLAASDRKVVEQILPSYTKINAETAAVITLGTFPTSINEQRLQRVADLMVEHQYLKSPIDAKTLLVGSDG